MTSDSGAVMDWQKNSLAISRAVTMASRDQPIRGGGSMAAWAPSSQKKESRIQDSECRSHFKCGSAAPFVC
jgi:hypothetical protein